MRQLKSIFAISLLPRVLASVGRTSHSADRVVGRTRFRFGYGWVRPPVNRLGFTLAVSGALALGATSVVTATGPPCEAGRVSEETCTATTALLVLRAAVDIPAVCGPCGCDVDGDAEVTSSDALRTIQAATDPTVTLECLPCLCASDNRVPTGQSPRSVTVADVDGDGRSDLLTANTESNDVTVIRGVRDSVGGVENAFEGDGQYSVGETPLSLKFADLNGDDIPDLLTTNALPGSLSIVLGNGDGTFGDLDADLTVVAGTGPINAEATDLDRDGNVDLIVANSLSDDLSVLLGNGDATFRTFERVGVGQGPRWVSVGDINGDDVPDAVSANREGNDLTILFGTSDGRLVAQNVIPVPAGPYEARLADMNGDADLDIVVSSYYDESVSVLLGQGDGSFTSLDTWPSGGNAIASTLSDVNGDSVLDVVVANLSNSVAVLLGNGDGSLLDAQVYGITLRPRALAVHDIDRDGVVDIVSANSKSHDLVILYGIGGGRFSNGVLSEGASFGVWVTPMHLDSDGLLDIVLAGQRNWLTAHHGDGGGGFGLGESLHTIRPPRRLIPADVDGDGDDDIVALTDAASYCTFLAGHVEFHAQARRANGASVIMNNGDGTFGEELVVDRLVSPDADVGDFDGDGVLDLVAADQIKQRPVLFRGNGDGTFQEGRRAKTLFDAWSCRAAILNGSAVPAAVCIAKTKRVLKVFRVNSVGEFETLQSRKINQVPGELVIGHVDSDEFLDALVIGDADGALTIYSGRRNGRLRAGQEATPQGLLRNARLVDLDRDGANDLVGMRDQSVVASRGFADGRFSEPVTLLSRVPGPRDRDPVAAYGLEDFDGDGFVDLVGTNSQRKYPMMLTVPNVGACLD